MSMPAYEQVLEDAIACGDVDAQDRILLSLAMGRALNMTADAGRPSDAMRSEVRSYVRLGRAEYLRVFEAARA